MSDKYWHKKPFHVEPRSNDSTDNDPPASSPSPAPSTDEKTKEAELGME